MADRTVRAIFEARVSGAKKGMVDLSKDVDAAGKKVDSLTKDLKGLDTVKVNPKITLAIKDAQRNIKELTAKLGELRTMDVTPEVTADIRQAERQLADARKALRQLDAAKATMRVTADTAPAKKEIKGLADDVGDAGAEGGDEAGGNIVTGILDALRTIPIAGAIVGIGVAIAGGILLGIKQGLAIEAERDLFSAQTGLDEDTSARFGRAAGEAYANAWGESVAANLDTARFALQAGIIDSDATDAEIENVIAKLQGLNDLFQYDIASSVRGVGNLMRSGLAKDADQAFDLIVAASQKVSSDDLIDTITEYSTQFKTLGLDGQTAMGLIVQAVRGGARDTDNAADTLKEMGLRIREGLDPAKDALKTLGLDAAAMVKAFQRGGPDAAAAMGTVFDALRDLEEKGGNTQAVIAALFGGPGEDLGAALFALDVDKAAAALNGAEGAAGAADTALTTMSDNTSTKMEEAKRNVELAMDGIKGALAEAFGDEIGGAADWISKNRAPLMQFFLDVMNGAFDMATAFVEFGATAQDTLADVIDGLAEFIDAFPGDQSDLKKTLNGVSDGLRDGADTMRGEWLPALDDMRDKANDWAGPEIMKARIHDATLAMTGDLDTFAENVKKVDGTVRINGDLVDAQEALDLLIENINAEDGTVTINGDKVPAEDALDEVTRLINSGSGDISIGADPANAEQKLNVLEGRISAAEAAMSVTLDTQSAERELAAFKARLRKLGIRVSGVTSVGGVHEGGYTGVLAGRHAGGRVPGADPGFDNVLWPLNAGGRTLAQPLAGGEYVVNSKDSAYWGPVLEWMNGGGRPTASSVTHDSRLMAEQVTIVTPSPNAFKRDLRTVPYRAKARPGRG